MARAARAEIVILNGPMAGRRYSLDAVSGASEYLIGSSSAAFIRLSGSGIAPRHCAIRYSPDAWRVFDLVPGRGAFVNGLRVESQPLQDGDQIEVAETALVFRTGEEEKPPGDAGTVLLRACSLLFLFRALASTVGDTAAMESNIVGLIGDILPIRGGAVILESNEAMLRKRAAARNPALAGMIRVAARDGFAVGAEDGSAAVPIYVRRVLTGLIQVYMDPEQAQNSAEALSAIAVLAAAAIENAREVEILQNRNALLSEQIDEETGPGGDGLVGESGAMKRLRVTIERLAPRDATVLIMGESGTGKELIARALHRRSSRAAAPFVAINCAALTENLLESEMFGHEKGAFTGAIVQKKGKFELAEGGTVFLDEIGELAPGLQAKLLRVLQEREFDRVGGSRTLKLDVRLIAATNRDLAAEVRKGAFREDLFHRLNVIAIQTAPLRERPEDIMPLARHFLALAANRHAREISGFATGAESLLRSYSWPGNVRELQNAIERATVLGIDEEITEDDLPDAIRAPRAQADAIRAPGAQGGPSEALETSLDAAKRETILRAWRQAAGDYKAAAAILEVHPNSLLRSIRKLGLRDTLRSL